MGLPKIDIKFISKASTAIKRGERGILAVLLKLPGDAGDEDRAATAVRLDDATALPEDLTDDEKGFLERAFAGGQNAVKYVWLIRSDSLSEGLAKAEGVQFDYFCAIPEMLAGATSTVISWVKSLRDNKGKKVKAVLPNTSADYEGIVNFTTDDIKVGEATYTAADYCSRIASLLAGTPLSVSATYTPLPEVDSVPSFTDAEFDAKIDAGEFCLKFDGRQVKVARAVNSLVTVGQEKSEDWKSCKIVDTADLIYTDIRQTCEDVYIGKFANSYDNKCSLILSVQAYLEALRMDNLLDQSIEVGIDLEKQENYLKGRGIDTSEMSEQEIKEANTQTFVFLLARYKILNAIEDISVRMFI